MATPDALDKDTDAAFAARRAARLGSRPAVVAAPPPPPPPPEPAVIDWQEAKYAPAKTFVLVRGPSTSTSCPEFIAVAFYDDDFRKPSPTGPVWLDSGAEVAP